MTVTLNVCYCSPPHSVFSLLHSNFLVSLSLWCNLFNTRSASATPKPSGASRIDVTDLASYVLVLANSLRLLKMLICKHASLTIFGKYPFNSPPPPFFVLTFLCLETYEVKPVFNNLENLLLTIIQFEYLPLDHHATLLDSIPFAKIYSIVKECCEMYLLPQPFSHSISVSASISASFHNYFWPSKFMYWGWIYFTHHTTFKWKHWMYF